MTTVEVTIPLSEVEQLRAELAALRAENERLTRAVESGSDRAAAAHIRETEMAIDSAERLIKHTDEYVALLSDNAALRAETNQLRAENQQLVASLNDLDNQETQRLMAQSEELLTRWYRIMTLTDDNADLRARLAAAEQFAKAIRALNPVNLCWMIERLPASTQQTEISIAASVIAHSIQQALAAYRASAAPSADDADAGGETARRKAVSDDNLLLLSAPVL